MQTVEQCSRLVVFKKSNVNIRKDQQESASDKLACELDCMEHMALTQNAVLYVVQN